MNKIIVNTDRVVATLKVLIVLHKKNLFTIFFILTNNNSDSKANVLFRRRQ